MARVTRDHTVLPATHTCIHRSNHVIDILQPGGWFAIAQSLTPKIKESKANNGIFESLRVCKETHIAVCRQIIVDQ